jgi:hypothetical protein
VYWAPLALTSSQLTEKIIMNAFHWWDSMLRLDNSVKDHGYLLFELFSCRDSLTGRDSSAWPRPPGYKHMLLLGAGCAPSAPTAEAELANEKVQSAAEEIFGEKGRDVGIVPNAMEGWNDAEAMYGPLGHLERLREVKRRYDPDDRVKGWIKP